MSRFLESQAHDESLALPGQRDEAWRYTSLKALEQRALAVGDPGAGSRPVPASLLDWPGEAPLRVVFVNGTFRPELSTLANGDGLSIGLDASPSARATGGDAFARLNALLARQRLVVRVAPGALVAQPLHVVHAGASAGADLGWYARCEVELGEGAALTLVERHVAASPHANVGNVSTSVRLAPHARLSWTRIQAEPETASLFAHGHAWIGESAALEHLALDAGGLLSRHALEVELAARGAAFRSRGVFALRGRQHCDTQLAVVHAARDTRCDVACRGLADGRARGVFGGAILMRPGADGADARLENKNLLLSPHAEIDTKPVLEIHADEVKAAHGATVGQLDERALFYLRSRGLPAADARGMLTYAFCASMFDAATPVLREHLRELLARQLGAAGRP